MMKKILIAIMVLAALAACNKKPAEQKEQKGAVLAKVGTAVITEGDVARELKSLPDYAQQMFADEKGKEKFVEELVKKEMLYQEAVKKGSWPRQRSLTRRQRNTMKNIRKIL